MMEYYDISNIYKAGTSFNIVTGMRTAGKTFAWKTLALAQFPEFDFDVTDKLISEGYFKKEGKLFIYVRRIKETVRATAPSLFTDIINLYNKENGTQYYIEHKSNKFYLMRYDEEKEKIIRVRQIGYSMYISNGEVLKSASYDDANLLVHEEALTSDYRKYLPNEVDDFIDIINTCFRLRSGNKVFLIGNVTSIINPYFDAWKIKNVSNGLTIHKYYNKLINKTISIAVEFTQPPDVKQKAKNNDFIGLASEEYVQYNIGDATKDDTEINVKRLKTVKHPFFSFKVDNYAFYVSRIKNGRKKLFISFKPMPFYGINPKKNVNTMALVTKSKRYYIAYDTLRGDGIFFSPKYYNYLREMYLNDCILFSQYQCRVRLENFLKTYRYL